MHTPSNSLKFAILCAVMLSALLIRLLALASLKETPYFVFLMPDEAIYDYWAQQMASGSYNPQAPYEFSPLPAYIMAGVYRLLGSDVLHIRILNIFLGTFTCFMVAIIGANLGGWLAGLSAGLVAALYGPFILYSIVPLKTALSLSIFAVFVYLFIQVLDHASILKLVLLGIVTSLAYNVRGNYLILLPVFCMVFAYHSRLVERSWHRVAVRLLVPIVAFACAQAPFAIRNYLVSGEFVLSTTQSGFNFYIGNNRLNISPYYRPVPFASPSPFEQGVQFTIEASRRAGRYLTASQASSFWYHEAWREMRANLGLSLKRLGLKMLALFNRSEAADHYDLEFLSCHIPFFRIPLFTFAILWPPGIAGLLLGAFLSRPMRLLTLVFISYSLTLVIFFMSARYRVPLMIIAIPSATVGLCQAFSLLKSRQRPYLFLFYLIVAVFFSCLLFLPLPNSQDKTAYVNFHAAALKAAGNEKQADTFWEWSVKLSGSYSDFARLALAYHYIRERDLNSALHIINEIPENSFGQAYKLAALGDTYSIQSKPLEAGEFYHRSLSINSGQLSVRRKLMQALADSSSPQLFTELAEYHYILSFYRGL